MYLMSSGGLGGVEAGGGGDDEGYDSTTRSAKGRPIRVNERLTEREAFCGREMREKVSLERAGR